MSYSLIRNVLLIGLLLAASSVFAQGKILLAVGDVSALRGGQRINLSAGANIESGDTIVTGAQSNAQLRLSDGTLIALKPDTEFRIDQYRYTGAPDGSEAAVYSLLKGGFRTITGQIGQLNRDKYRVNTTRATIGIRGTHFKLQLCAAQECIDDDGNAAAVGLYGGILDGAIGVANSAGTVEFGVDEYFFVAADNALPQRLIAPPGFLRDQLVARLKSQRQATRAVALSKVPELRDPETYLPVSRYSVTEDRKKFGEAAVDRSIVIGSDANIIEIGSTNTARAPLLGYDREGHLNSFNNGSLIATRGTAQIVDTGRADDAGHLRWGRWSGPGSTITQNFPNSGSANNNGGNLHYILGDVASQLPTSGQVTYSPVGGTRPTDSASGATGTLISGGTINVNFTTAQLALSGLTVGFTNATYTLSGSASILNGLFSTAGGSSTTFNCTGNNCQRLIAGNFLGFFAGRGGTGIGLDYYFNTPSSVIEGVVGYRRNGR